MTTSNRPIWTAGSTSTADTVGRSDTTAGRTQYSYGEMCDMAWRCMSSDDLMRAVFISQMAVADRLDRLCEIMARSR